MTATAALSESRKEVLAYIRGATKRYMTRNENLIITQEEALTVRRSIESQKRQERRRREKERKNAQEHMHEKRESLKKQMEQQVMLMEQKEEPQQELPVSNLRRPVSAKRRRLPN